MITLTPLLYSLQIYVPLSSTDMFTTQHLPILEAPAGREPITVAVRPQGIPLCLPPCECVDCVSQFRSDQDRSGIKC